jgi:ABC-type multidrug transport system fused ATPase/permease subunit
MKQIFQTLKDLLPLLPAGARRFFVVFIVATSFITLLDVAAMALLAVLIAPIVNSTPIDIPFLGKFGLSEAPVLVLIACGLIILKSALSVLLQWIATKRFATYELQIGERMFTSYIHSSWEERSKRTVAEITRIADAGIANTVMGFLLPLAKVPSLFLTFGLIFLVLVIADPVTALVALVYLALVAFVVNKVVTKRALVAGQVNLDYSYRVAILMTEMVDALKELSLRGKLGQVADVVTRNRKFSVRARGNISFLGIIPLYAFEAALVGGFILVGVGGFITGGANGALASVALFAATGFRLIPAINGLQTSIVQGNASSPAARDVINDLNRLKSTEQDDFQRRDSAALPDRPVNINLRNVSFHYHSSTVQVLRDLNLEIPLGSSLGIVGPSGAGKSTLIDLLLGLSVPTAGSIDIDGVALTDVIHSWRDRVGYVPQRVALFDGSIAQNVALTWDEDFNRDKVVEALERAQLGSLVNSREGGIDAKIGERGFSLSGGQQQRLGIARALYSEPLVLVLDEATSSLDTKTEDDVSQAIRSLRGEVTIISVAHRLSTIKDYDQVCYLHGGNILGKGTFSELARQIPEFGEQVALAGLTEKLRLTED